MVPQLALLSSALLAALWPNPAGLAAPAQEPCLVRFQVDPVAHGAFLEDLARLRRERACDQIPARVAHEQVLLDFASAELEARIEALGGQVASRQYLDPGLVVRGVAAERLAELKGVRSVEPNRYLAPASLQVALNAQHHDTQGANLLLDGQGQTIEGTGVVIGLIDTGIDAKMGALNRPHVAFYRDANPAQQIPGGLAGSRILSAIQLDFFGTPLNNPEDLNGHGTRLASIALGFRYNFNPGVANGAAPDALLRSYRIDNDVIPGVASFLTMNEALDRAVQDGDVGVILLAWDGTSNPELGCNPSIDAAVRAGVTVVASGGNFGNAKTFHGCFNGLVLGASDLQAIVPYNDPAFFISPEGPLIDGRVYPKLLAVGENLTSAVPDNEQASVGSYGTSGAAAITAGTVALMLQAAPSLTPRQIRAILVDTAATVTQGDLDARSYGYLRSKRAVQAAQAGAAEEGSISGLATYAWPITLAAGQSFRSTVVWDQVNEANPFNDIDLRLRAPNGSVIAEARGYHDTLEQVRVTATAAGTYSLELELVSTHPSTPALTYAITGVPAIPAQILPPACSSSVAVATSFQQGNLTLPVIEPQDPYNDVLYTVVKGCGLNQVNSARIGITPVAFTLESPKALRLKIPPTTPKGINIVTLGLVGGGSLQGILSINGDPLLSAPTDVSSAGGGYVVVKYEPSSPFVLVCSFSLIPSSFPGIVDFALGNAAQELFVLASGALGSGGTFGFYISNQSLNPALLGKQLHFQAGVFDLVTLSGPLLTTNVGSTLLVP